MKQYAVAHVSKGKGASSGLTQHFDRVSTPPNADPERTHLNHYENHSALGRHLGERADTVIQRAGVTRKVQANAVKYCPIILSGSHDQMKKLEEVGGIDQWYQDTKQFAEDRYGKENIISFVMHRDEETPHIHCTVVPIIKDKDKKGNDRARLSAREKFDRLELLSLQTDYANAMKAYGLERGEEGSKAKHTTVQQFYKELPDRIKELEKDIKGRQSEVLKLKALAAQYSASRGLKEAAEGFGAGAKELFTGGKKKRESLEAENAQLKDTIAKQEQHIKSAEPYILKGVQAERDREQLKLKMVDSFKDWTNKLLASCGVDDVRIRTINGGKDIETYNRIDNDRSKSNDLQM